MLRDPTYMGVTPSSGGRLDAGRARRVDDVRAHELRQGGNRASTRTSHTERRRHASATSRWAFARDSALELRGARQAAEGDEADASVHVESSGFAATRIGGAPTDPDQGRERDAPGRPRRPGCATTNRVDDEGLAAAAGRRRGRRQLPGCGTLLAGLQEPATVPIVEGYDEATAALSPEDQAEAAAAAIAAAPGLGLYGYYTSGVTEIAVASTTGLAVSAGDDRRERARARRLRGLVGLRGRRPGAPPTSTRAGPRGRGRRPPDPRRRGRAAELPRGARAVRDLRAPASTSPHLAERARPARGRSYLSAARRSSSTRASPSGTRGSTRATTRSRSTSRASRRSGCS